MKRLNLGCGRKILEGWINLDCVTMEGVDVVADLDKCSVIPLPFKNNSIDEFLGSHVLEHLENPLDLMQDLHRIAKKNAIATFSLPYGSSDDAYEDPTHKKLYFINSFGYFSQPFYWKADYGYRGDWQPERITLVVEETRFAGKSSEEIMRDIMTCRNVVIEMVAELRAIKPIRINQPQVPPKIEIFLSKIT